MTDWERETGVPWGVVPLDRAYPAVHHFRSDGSRIVGTAGPWRWRDRLARRVGFHCWECWWL